MTTNEWLPLAVLASSLLPGLVIFALPESWTTLRTTLNLFGAVAKLVLVAVLLAGVSAGEAYGVRFAVLPGLDLVFKADALAVLFVALSAVLWLVTTIYAIGYLKDSPHRSRFFGFFSLCVSATMGIAMAGNLVTFLIFYELLTVRPSRWSCIAAPPTRCSGGKIYLAYTVAGGAAAARGIAWLSAWPGQSSSPRRHCSAAWRRPTAWS